MSSACLPTPSRRARSKHHSARDTSACEIASAVPVLAGLIPRVGVIILAGRGKSLAWLT
jgi:hypothetical protein